MENIVSPDALANLLVQRNVKIPEVRVRGRVTNLWKETETTNCLIQGVKGKDQNKIERDPMIRGSNGTYLAIGEYCGKRLYINISLYKQPRFEHAGICYEIPCKVQIECYEETRNAIKDKVYGKYAITENTMENLKEMLRGKKFDFILAPIKAEEDTLLVWLWIPNIMYPDGENLIYPFGGVICARPIQL